MPFGKHKGSLLSLLPMDYLEWVLGIAKPPLKEAVKAILSGRGGGKKAKADYVSPVKAQHVWKMGDPLGELKEGLDTAPDNLF